MKSNFLHAWTSFLESLYETPNAFFASGLAFASHLNTVYSAFVVFVFPFEQNTLTLARLRQDFLSSAFCTSAGVKIKIITVSLDISPH